MFNGSEQNRNMNALAQLPQMGIYGDVANQPNPPSLRDALSQVTAKQPEKKSMFKEIATDVKGFVLEHRSIIYFIAFALLLDHVFFKGAFKARLQGMADKIVAKVEAKI